MLSGPPILPLHPRLSPLAPRSFGRFVPREGSRPNFVPYFWFFISSRVVSLRGPHGVHLLCACATCCSALPSPTFPMPSQSLTRPFPINKQAFHLSPSHLIPLPSTPLLSLSFLTRPSAFQPSCMKVLSKSPFLADRLFSLPPLAPRPTAATGSLTQDQKSARLTKPSEFLRSRRATQR